MMEQMIGAINDLHEAFSEVKIDDKMNLPQIAVVGGQSSGKSSVLENIVGRDFLPRGSGMVTRCPLVLQLIQTYRRDEEWAEFGHLQGKRFTNFDEVRAEIIAQTDKLCPKDCVCGTPINLRVYSPKVLNLTLVDLPGLVATATAGQPVDIPMQIRTMVKKYISQTNTLILAISAANQDIATSEGLQLAREVDPSSVRTLGVLTKLDLMDEGTDAMQILKGNVIALRRGFIGVVNRSQKDINNNKNITDARKAEIAYFQTHRVYSQIADQCGTEYLTKTLSKLLLESIHASLPELSLRVDAMLAQTRKQMEKFGLFESQSGDKSNLLLSLLQRFRDSVKEKLEGCASEGTKADICGGARIEWIFNDHVAPYIMAVDATAQLHDERIRVTMMNMHGMNAAIFPSERVFTELAKEQILRLDAPSLRTVDFVYDELLNIVRECSTAVAERFPELQRRLVEVTGQLLRDLQGPTKDHVRTMIRAEHARINVKHPDMVEKRKEVMQRMFETQYGPSGAVSPQQPPATAPPAAVPVAQRAAAAAANFVAEAAQAWEQKQHAPIGAVPPKIFPSGPMAEHERAMCRAVRDLVCAYFRIVQRNVVDQTPKAVVLLLVEKLKEDLHSKLVKELYSPDNCSKLLAEPDDIVKTRAALTSMHKCLSRAQEAVNRVKDLRLH
jgi:dynamin 1-like protein